MPPTFWSDSLLEVTTETDSLTVSLSNELATILSSQLYRSPLKAIEELVVNGYDAEATECRLFVPEPTDNVRRFVVVFDNGSGMDSDGLTDLWHIGHSRKREPDVETRAQRKQIGKFGIGKLATYTIANKLTYVSKKAGSILTVSLDFSSFTANPHGPQQPIKLPVRKLTNLADFLVEPQFRQMCDSAGLSTGVLDGESWTLAILEDLRPRSNEIRIGRLRRVLETAMPLKADFKVFLNKEEVASSKATAKTVVEFSLAELPAKRLNCTFGQLSDIQAAIVIRRWVRSRIFRGSRQAAVIDDNSASMIC